ncbi:3'-5' exonuclease [Paenibacillus soyae]|uniref:3'-5' exonuclease n=1 Tax=Paenibacillus soyae TaxID=2969249 RepID=A0A9X2MV63_9BACL|nr:3'-5' exonuclease [Paenibacillus soyae]MCR2806912.1 3'-5' exonuclease [Paenibacillus soyae]
MKLIDHSESEYVITDFILEELDKRQYCVFDFEATGPDPVKDSITQIGAVILGQDGSIVTRYKTLVRPPKPIPEAIEKLTGISNHDVEKAPSFSEIIAGFLAFIKGCVLVTQAGYEYDLPLLTEECRRSHTPLDDLAVLDTKALFTYLHPEVSAIVSTNFLIQHYVIPDADIQRHDALGDSILIARIFNKIIEECSDRGIRDIRFDSLKVKKVQLPPL